LLWLVLPQTQGATKLYFEYVHPTLTKHEGDIEEFISRAHDQARAAGAEYVQRLYEIVKQMLFGALPQAEQQRPPTPAPRDAASYAQALFSRWRVPPLAPSAPQMATDFYNFLSTALQQSQQPASGAPQVSNLIPPHVKTPGEKARFIEMQRQRLTTVMAALETEMENLGGNVHETSAAGGVHSAADNDGGGLFKSYSHGHLSTYEGDFDHVSMADAPEDAGAAGGGGGGGEGWRMALGMGFQGHRCQGAWGVKWTAETHKRYGMSLLSTPGLC
jgi:receptor expression-enhancing protein 1/2/3/4